MEQLICFWIDHHYTAQQALQDQVILSQALYDLKIRDFISTDKWEKDFNTIRLAVNRYIKFYVN